MARSILARLCWRYLRRTEKDPITTQRDAGFDLPSTLRAAGLDDAEEIGHGGFGVVYRCSQPALDRTVAVKVLTGGST